MLTLKCQLYFGMPPKSSKKSSILVTNPEPYLLESLITVKEEEQSPVPAPAEDTGAEPRRKRGRVQRRSSDLVSAVPSAVFRRLVKEITSDIKSDLRWEAEALAALQTDAEAYLIGRFGEADRIRELCNSGTLKRAHFAVS